MELVPVPYETAKLLALAQEIDEYWLSDDDRTDVGKSLLTLRHNLFSKSSLNRHQIGGLPYLIQGHDHLTCPNPNCKRHQAAKKFMGGRMLEPAVIHNDPQSGLPMIETLEELSKPSDFNEYIQVVYWICEECPTLTTSNRCD